MARPIATGPVLAVFNLADPIGIYIPAAVKFTKRRGPALHPGD
jgi:hypothetical protein